ncbi:unnamed protein product [Brugia pahangi]|uniref:Mucolipin-2 n=1 Tax=Brugia pahangi TaxID=6280 RepID=A0A158PPU8_BRUPA|nr:unnamed protein product [Brugia pahangi]
MGSPCHSHYIKKASYLKSYSFDEINVFIDLAEQLNLTSLISIENFQNQFEVRAFIFYHNTIQEQHDFFYESYTTSESSKSLLSRDRNHWNTTGLASSITFQHYHFMQCLQVAVEIKATASEYSFIYYNAYGDLQSNSSTVGLCLPVTCLQDKLQVGNVLSFALDVFLAFSRIRTFQTIMNKSNGQKKVITCIFGWRVIAIAWGYLKILDEYRDTLKNNFLHQIVTNCFFSMDAFFLL